MIGVYRELKGLAGISVFEIPVSVSEDEYQEEVQKGRHVGARRKPPKPKRVGGVLWSWTKNRDIAYSALERASFKCEVEENRKTFESRKTKHQFMEAHHLVPMEFQDSYQLSLDIPENIICLCPTCHRSFHHATKEKLLVLIDNFYNKRQKKSY
jgi:5-methylcytosine-specific restriction protein A